MAEDGYMEGGGMNCCYGGPGWNVGGGKLDRHEHFFKIYAHVGWRGLVLALCKSECVAEG